MSEFCFSGVPTGDIFSRKNGGRTKSFSTPFAVGEGAATNLNYASLRVLSVVKK